MLSGDAANSRKLPTISVVTVVFNGRESIAETIDSVLAQDYPCVEYIVIDGDSTDGTKDIVERYRDRLDLFVSERDLGVYDAMNKAIKLATGEFILFMNCGDQFASSDAVSSVMCFIEPEGDQIFFGGWSRRIGDLTLVHCRPSLEKGLFNHQAVIYSRQIHVWHGGYVNVKGLTAADYLFFATLFDSAAVSCKVVESTIAIIDVHGLSAGPQTLGQKFAIDFICGRVGKMRLMMILVFHPVYRLVKTMLGLRR
jgi:glycosyltransferase involved in cell wall biosynthesis